MTVAFYMNCVSTHQLPLAKEVTALVGRENFGYVYEGESDQAYQRVADVGDVEVKVKGEGEQRTKSRMRLGVDSLPALPKDTTD